MSNTGSTTPNVRQVPDVPIATAEEVIGCTAAIFWSVRTLRVGLGVFEPPCHAFAADVVADHEYAVELVELYKGILLDKLYAERRAGMADRVLSRVGAALAARNDPATEAALQQPLDVEKLSTFPAIPAWRMNDLRPALPWPLEM